MPIEGCLPAVNGCIYGTVIGSAVCYTVQFGYKSVKDCNWDRAAADNVSAVRATRFGL